MQLNEIIKPEKYIDVNKLIIKNSKPFHAFKEFYGAVFGTKHSGIYQAIIIFN